MGKLKKKQFGKAEKKWVAGFLFVAMVTNMVSMSETGRNAIAAEAEQDYIITFDDARQCHEFIDGVHSQKMNQESKELLEDTGIMLAQMTDSEAEQLKQEEGIASVEKDFMVSANANEKEAAEEIQRIAKSQWNRKAVHADARKRGQEIKNSEEKVKVAVLDSGVAVTEDIDIKSRVNLVDEEESSYLCEDMTGHGTAVASVLVAKDNKMGTTGMDERITVYSVKVLDSKNMAPVSRIIAGIQWCMDNGMNIINMSFGMCEDSKALRTIIREAEQKGILLVAAAGNDGNGENTTEYPAAYPEVLGVGSITSEMKRSENSARGKEIELVAPGENVPVTSMFGGVTLESGTSYAAPHVSAVAAMLWTSTPSWDAQKIRAWIDAGARKLEDRDCGNGLIDYAYCKKIQKKFEKNYIPQETKDEICAYPYENKTELREYKMPEVSALWNSDGHNKLITTTVSGSDTWQAAYTSDKCDVLKMASLFADTGSGESGGEFVILSEVDLLHALGETNYIATVCYLYELSILQKNNPTKSITSIMEEYKGYHGLDSDMAALRQLKKAVNITCKASMSVANYSGTAKEAEGKNRGLRILGLAMHVAGDAYAHKAIVYNNDAVKDMIRNDINVYFTGNVVNNTIIPAIENNYITTSRLSALSYDVRGAHKAYSDNPGFCPRRYQYGAQNVVQVLMKSYYNKSKTFDIKAFYNYGTNKNNISQFRLAKYAAEANGGTAPAGVNWSAYSKG